MHALAGYTSAIVLAIVALSMLVESVRRLWHPETIHFAEALPVAVLGLVVNLVSIKLLGHDHGHEDDEHEQDAAGAVNVPWSEYQPLTPRLGLWR